ncbi:MAG: FtsH protease activity modulator HflK [Deltaproteobacteria bacterium]|nr:FtsH protease activity modulator HflK [Deltaproteobacteria bacterium]MBW1834169.1 FtsH protease activity modulator HflK [Deltaproteobacteria bacterium]MBW2166408.1 FtsH protease activity modulator HflK [Deltaproteobacteria bacterium]
MSWDWEKLKQQQQRKTGGSGVPPQVDEILKNIKQFKFPGGPILIIILIALFFGSSTFFTVGVDEVGVVQRFGKYIRVSQPGLNFKLPAGIEKVTKVKVKRVYKEEFGFRSPSGEARKLFASGGVESMNVSLMLTGDLNVGLVPWIVQYKVKDPYNYLFKVQDPRKLLIDMSEASMRLVVGDRSINEVITKREEIAVEARQHLQAEMDKSETGIGIVTIEMKKTNVPEAVQPSFNEVNQAVQEKEKLIYQAKEDYNKAIPQARGEAERTIKAAEGYSLDRINRAKGDASRFVALYQEYVKAKDITRRRLYLEALTDLFPKLGHKYIIDSEQKNLLPLLNLGKNGVAK